MRSRQKMRSKQYWRKWKSANYWTLKIKPGRVRYFAPCALKSVEKLKIELSRLFFRENTTRAAPWTKRCDQAS